MTSNLTAEQVLEKAITWLRCVGNCRISPDTANRLKQYCLQPAETDKQKALGLLQMHDCPTLGLSAYQVELIRNVVERCPDDSAFFVSVDGITQGPAPAPSKFELAVGQVWRRRDLEIVTIVKLDKSLAPYCFVADDGRTYTAEGRYLEAAREGSLDLVALLATNLSSAGESCEH